MHLEPIMPSPAPAAISAGCEGFPNGIRFIEFFGLPGIGKTTAASLLATRLRQAGTVVDEKRATWEDKALVARQANRLKLVLPRLLDRDFRAVATRMAAFVAEGGQEASADRMRWTWNLWSVAAYLREERSKTGADVTILDQGLLQGFWSVLLKSRQRGTSEHWLDILSAIGIDDIVFVDLRGGTDLARHRLQGREDRASRLQRETTSGEGALWTKAERAYRTVAADLWRRQSQPGPAPMLATVEMAASISPEEVADRTLQAVQLAYRRRHDGREQERPAG